MKMKSSTKKKKWWLILYTALLASFMLVTSMPVYAAEDTPITEEDVLDTQNVIEEIPEVDISLEEPVRDNPKDLQDPLPNTTVAPEDAPTDSEANAVATTCTVRFGNNAGTNIYAGYTMTVAYGTTITLPEVPKTTGYRNRGWAFTAHSEPTHFPGDSYKVTGDVLFHAVRVQQFTVKFNNNSGTTVAPVYDTLTMVVDRDSKVTLPAVPKASGYKNLGWTTVVNSPTVTNEAGSQYTVTGDITFYAVRRKLAQYTIKFNNNSGTNMGSPYDAMTMTVQEGSSITLPALPGAKGYRPLGWTTTVNSLVVTNKAGTSYTPTHDVTFYTVRMRVFSTRFYNVNGKVFSSLNKDTDREISIVIPSIENPAGKTILGWSTVAGTTSDPEYEFGQTVTPMSDLKLYPVVITHPLNYTTPIVDPGRGKYSKIIFVGDSRFYGFEDPLKLGQEIDGLPNSDIMDFISAPGKGLDWFINTGEAEVNDLVQNETGRIAIIFNLGINDISIEINNDSEFPGCLTRYRNCMASFRTSMQAAGKNCDLYYMSVNPVNNCMIIKHNTTGQRPEARVLEFNEMLNSLPGYTYIDTYHDLIKTGYVFSAKQGADTKIDDGIHYNTVTYRKIFNYCINQIKK